MELTRSISKIRISTNTILGILFVLMIGDYFITYFGIHNFDIVEEANPLMVRFMELPLWKGTIIRIFYSLFFISTFKFVEKYKDPIVFRRILLVPLGIQVIPYVAHIYWIWKYIEFSSYIS